MTTKKKSESCDLVMSRVPDEKKTCQQKFFFLECDAQKMGQMEINSKHRLFICFILTFMQKTKIF